MELSALLSSFLVYIIWSANPVLIYGLQVDVQMRLLSPLTLASDGLRVFGLGLLSLLSTTVCIIVTTKVFTCRPEVVLVL